MKKVKSILKKNLNIKNIVLILIILTITYILFHPQVIFDGSKKFITSYTKLLSTVIYIHNPQKNDTFYTLSQSHNHIIERTYRYPLELRKTNQITSSNIIYEGRIVTDLFNDQDQSYLFYIKEKAQLMLNIYEYETNQIQKQAVYNMDSLFYLIKDSTITKNNIKFYKYNISDKENEDIIELEKYKDGFRFSLSKSSLLNLFKYYDYYNLENCKEYNYLLKLINHKLKTPKKFNCYDIYDIFYFFIASNNIKNRWFKYMRNDILPLEVAILGASDINNDKHKELFFQIELPKMFAKIFICYDWYNKEILWKKRMFPTIRNIIFFDVNKDGENEILCTTYAPCHEMPLNYNELKCLPHFYSYLFILNKDGEMYKIRGKEALIRSQPGFLELKPVILPDKNIILLGLKSNYDYRPKNFITYNYETGTVDTLDIIYHNILDIKLRDNKITFWDQNKNILSKFRLDSGNLEITDKIIKKNKTVFTEYYSDKVELFGEKYDIAKSKSKTIILFDDNLNKVQELPHDIEVDRNLINVRNNTIHFIEKNNNRTFLSKISFKHNNNLNFIVIIIVILEFILLIIYFILKQLLSVPVPSASENYFLIHSFWGLFYVWRLTGSYNQLFKLPKKVSCNKMLAYRYLHGISNEVELIYSYSRFLITTKVYKIQSFNDYEIIQQLAHDLKNEIFILKLQVDDLKQKDNIPFSPIKILQETVLSISNSIQILAQFSRINELYKEKISILDLLEEILNDFYKHPKINSIQITGGDNIFLQADLRLLKSALKNIISNALDAVSGEEKIKIKITKKENNLLNITITNPTDISEDDFLKTEKIGFSTKENGSGLGIALAKTIIEKHNGQMKIRKEEGNFIVEINLQFSTNSLKKGGQIG